jgi:hypothetical protein
MKTNKLFGWLGFFLSINQGVTVVLGALRDGTLRGADVIMPMDIPLYLLFFLKRDQTSGSRYRNLALFAKICMFLFLVLALAGSFVAYEPAQYRFKLVHLVRAMAVCYCMMTRLSTVKEVRSLANGLLMGLAFQSFIGFYQWQVGPLYLPFFNLVEDWRVTGAIGVANAFGVYLITLLPLCVRMALFSRMKIRYLWYVTAVTALGSLFATYTRSAWLGFGLSMVLTVIFDFKGNKLEKNQKIIYILLGIAFLGVMAGKYGSVITGRMSDSKEAISSDKKHSRMGLARDAMRIIKENKLLGVGLDNYRYHADKEIQGLQIVHNAYLLIAAEQGIPSLVIFIVFNLTLFIASFKLLKSKDKLIYHVGSSVLAGLLAALFYHLAAPDYRLLEVLVQQWRLGGMVVGLLVTDDLLQKKQARAKQIAKQRNQENYRQRQSKMMRHEPLQSY